MLSVKYRGGGRVITVGALIVAVGAVLVLAAATLAGCGSDTYAAEPTSQATTSKTSGGTTGGAPDFSGKTLDGTAVSLSAYRGKPLVLVFMASWCGACGAEAPEIDRFYAEYGDKVGLLVMAVGDTRAAMDKFMQAGGWDFPVMMCPDSVAMAYRVQYIPTVYVLDAEGRAVARPEGLVTAAVLAELVTGL